MARKNKDKKSSFGGITFMLSMTSLFIIALHNLYLLKDLIDQNTTASLGMFVAGGYLGYLITKRYFYGRFAVFIHELKHAIIATISGNKFKDIHIGQDSGFYKYEYTEKTARYNGFIALAPYWVPLFSLPVLISGIFLIPDQSLRLFILGTSYAADLTFSARDVSPLQTDFKMIEGGFKTGFAYILIVNLAIFSFYAIYICKDLQGFQQILISARQLGFGR